MWETWKIQINKKKNHHNPNSCPSPVRQPLSKFFWVHVTYTYTYNFYKTEVTFSNLLLK